MNISKNISSKSFIKSVSIRVNYYSLKEFRELYFKYLQTKKGIKNFASRPLTEEEKEKVDIDSISYNMSLTFEDILSQNCLILEPIKYDGYDMSIIIGAHFLYCRADITDFGKYTDQSINTFQELLNFVSFKEYISLINIDCQTHSGVYFDNIEIKDTIFNGQFFPCNYSELENARYVDSYRVDDNIRVDLLREYRKGINRQNQKTAYSFAVDSIVSVPCTEYIVDKKISLVLFKGIEYVTKCYN